MGYTAKNYRESGDKTVISGELAIEGGKLTKDGQEVILDGYTLPAATTSTIGGVKQAVSQADSTAADTAGLVADFNALLAKLKDAGIMA